MAASDSQQHTTPVGVLVLFLTLRFSSGFIGGGDTYRRTLSVELNPGLNSSATPLPPGVNLLHVRALGNNDTLHLLLCSQGAPTLLLVHTNTSSSSVQVDWPAFLARNTTGSLSVEPKSSVLYSSAVVITRLWEYDDVNDTADPQHALPGSFLPPYQLESFSWSGLDNTTQAGQPVQLCGGDGSPSFSNGSLCLTFLAFEDGGRDQNWPSLLHNANSSQIKVWLNGLLPRANNSRFSLELQAVGGASPLDRVDVLRSIDDEFTPSIFKVSQWVSSPPNASSPVLGYTQWKPVAYRKSKPVFEDATPCSHAPPVPVTQAAPPSGLVRAYYGLKPATTGLNVSFGITGGPFYNSTNFLSWTVLVGIGTPPVDSFSPLVISIMAVGLGTPLILILLGGVFVCVRKRAVPQIVSYEPIN